MNTGLAEAGQHGDSLFTCGNSRGTDRGTGFTGVAAGGWVDEVVVGRGKEGETEKGGC